ncbi:hypothetical protein F5X99DRAFT_403347 [Biscogniauxia marginata]|nr:hypothetical protein F5X99DRAFT_403347 [Biscogniauxia marginata]
MVAFNPYMVLGVAPNDNFDTIKKAYHKLCLRYHPDKAGQTAEAHEAFVKIQASYEILSDPKRRREYDQKGNNFVHTRNKRKPARGPRSQQYPASRNAQTYDRDFILRSRVGAAEMTGYISQRISRIQEHFFILVLTHSWCKSKPFDFISDCLLTKKRAVAELRERMKAIPLGLWKDSQPVREIVSAMYQLKADAENMAKTLNWLETIAPTMEHASDEERAALEKEFMVHVARWQ